MGESRQEKLDRAAREREAEAQAAAGGGAPAAAAGAPEAEKETDTRPAAGVKAACPIEKNAGRVPCGKPVAVSAPGKGVCREHGEVNLPKGQVNEDKAAKLERVRWEAEGRERAARAAKAAKR